MQASTALDETSSVWFGNEADKESPLLDGEAASE